MEHRQILLGLLVLVIVFPFCTSSIIDTITPTRQLLADGTILVSKEKNFALGFFSPGNSSYLYVGIWYFKIPEKTVVWVANRDNPIKGSSGVLWIDTLGNLVLNQTNQNLTLWSTNVSGSATTGNRVAKLLDTGNLVLIEEKTGKEVWQSFDYPSNTMLPGMKLGVDLKSGLNRFLTSWKSPADPGTGEYSVKLDPRGAPQLFLYKGLTPIWRSRSWPWNGVVDTALVYSLNYSFVKDDDDEIYLVYVVDDDSIISRLVLDDSGNFERFTWLIDVGRWKGYMSAPKSYCEFYGQCGANSICHPNEVYSFECSCLPGFQPTSPEDWYLRDRTSGCMRKHGAYTCGDGGVGFLEVGKVKVPDTSATRVEMGLNLRACEEACLLNCSCTAYSSISIPGDRTVCLTWYGGLIDMAEYSNGGFDFYVRADAIDLAENRRKSKVFFQKKGILVIHITSAAVALFLMVIFVYLWLKKRKAGDSLLTKVKPEKCRTPTDLPFLDLSTILSATNNFSLCNKLGEGGFGSVYKGKLADGQDIAVKRLSKNSGQGIQEFKNEVALIAKLQHRNLAKLLGSCIEGEETILIYEYLPNKSLDSFIFDQTRRAILNWRKRFEIIVGIARGVLYLHQDSRLRIIHRDLKTSNILLDDDMNPKISDFGMARIFGGDKIQDNTKRVVGTFGYMSPEYATLGQFSTKSDVFSFGVILLEIVSGKRNSSYYQGGSSLTLIGRIWALWKQERALEMADSSLRESFIPHEVLRCIHVGLLCVQENVTDRPTMLEVVLILVSETTLPLPKEPAFIFGTCNPVDSSAKGETPCSVNDVTISNLEAR